MYRIEWLELVFENRNKEYAAYYLRKHYAHSMVKAMVITFAGITVSCIASLLFTPIHLTPHRPDKGLLVTLNNIVVKHQIATPEKTKPVAALKPALAGKTNQFLPFVLKPDSQTSNLPLNIDLNGAIGQLTAPVKRMEEIFYRFKPMALRQYNRLMN